MLFCHALVTYMYEEDPTERTTRVTFAVEQTEDQTYSYAAAWTAPSDNFAKKTGRQIASARLSNGSPHTSTPSPPVPRTTTPSSRQSWLTPWRTVPAAGPSRTSRSSGLPSPRTTCRSKRQLLREHQGC